MVANAWHGDDPWEDEHKLTGVSSLIDSIQFDSLKIETFYSFNWYDRDNLSLYEIHTFRKEAHTSRSLHTQTSRPTCNYGVNLLGFIISQMKVC